MHLMWLLASQRGRSHRKEMWGLNHGHKHLLQYFHFTCPWVFCSLSSRSTCLLNNRLNSGNFWLKKGGSWRPYILESLRSWRWRRMWWAVSKSMERGSKCSIKMLWLFAQIHGQEWVNVGMKTLVTEPGHLFPTPKSHILLLIIPFIPMERRTS